ncbi:MAG: FHA domain-containing protein [Clostridia bacterium]|nr:FHA domain-containing protein [Clostridia bacterium]NCC75547.1 FHA domain-containing protein [Clostridia bacterium]
MMLEQSNSPNQVVYTLEKGESWVDFQLDFLIQSRPGWALETAIRVKDGCSQMVFDLSGLATAESIDARSLYLPEQGKDRIKAILEAFDKAVDVLFSEPQIALDPHHVLFDPSTGQARLMILPVNRSGGSDSLESLIRSIAKAYHVEQEALDSFLSLAQGIHPAKSGVDQTDEQQPRASATDKEAADKSQSVPGRQNRTSSWAKLCLVAAHIVLPILWLIIWIAPSTNHLVFSRLIITEPFRSWGFLALGGCVMILLLVDLNVSGIWHQLLVQVARTGDKMRSHLAFKKAPTTPAQANTAGVADQTELIQVQQSAYRLGLLSVGMPGTPQEMEGLRAYILVDEFLIGRDDAVCDLPLSTSSVGRRHARITRHEGSFFITDLGSKNGTSLDGRRLNKLESYLLPDRCRIEFANQAFYFAAD